MPRGRDYKYDKQDIIKHLRKCLEIYGKLTVPIYHKYRKNHKESPSLDTITRRYGWLSMVREVGSIPVRSRNRDEIITQFRENILSLGYIPSAEEYMKLKLTPTLKTILKHSRSYPNAIRSAGLTYPFNSGGPKIVNKTCPHCFTVYFPPEEKLCPQCFSLVSKRKRQKFNHDQAIDVLRSNIEKLGYLPTFDEYENMKLAPSYFQLNKLGYSYCQAVERAFPSGKYRCKRRINRFKTEKDILKALKEEIERIGYIPSASEYQTKYNLPNIKQLKRFGYTYSKAIEKLYPNAVVIAKERYGCKENLLKAFKLTIVSLGKVPTANEYIKKKYKPSLQTLFNYNLTYLRALKEVGLIPDGTIEKEVQRYSTDEEMFEKLIDSTCKLGGLPKSTVEYQKKNLNPSLQTFYNRGYTYSHIKQKYIKLTRECPECGIRFKRSGKKEYCTTRCRDKNKQREYREQRIAEGLCPQCGGKWIEPDETHKGKPKHCLKCQEYYAKRNKS